MTAKTTPDQKRAQFEGEVFNIVRSIFSVREIREPINRTGWGQVCGSPNNQSTIKAKAVIKAGMKSTLKI
jgi:hypothetical protein